MSNENKMVFTTDLMEEIKKKTDDGYKITRQEKYWLSNEMLVRKKGLVFKRTTFETIEYMKCKMGECTLGRPYIDQKTQTLKKSGIQYFAEKFCKIKIEDGSIDNMKLRDYQEEILDLYIDNRFSILMASRQVGKCFEMSSTMVIREKDTKVLKNLKFFKFSFQIKKNKNIFDYIKYGLYSLISVLGR